MAEEQSWLRRTFPGLFQGTTQVFGKEVSTMATQQQGDMAVWHQALAGRDLIIRQLREENSVLRGRLGEYITALGERDTIIRDLRRQLAEIRRQQPPALTKEAVEGEGPAEIPDAPPAAPAEEKEE